MAFRAGSATPVSTKPRVVAHGTVQGLVSGRALVRLDQGGHATIWPELTAPGVAPTDLLIAGMRVLGELDATSGRLDVTRMLTPPRPHSRPTSR